MITPGNRPMWTATAALVSCSTPVLGDVSVEATKLLQDPQQTEATGATTMALDTTKHSLKMPGATIYYEVRGTGPVLLVIPGGPQDAGVFAELAGHLSGEYTVVTFDPRGNSRSTIDGMPEDLDVGVLGDDAAAIIAKVGGGPAYVFGTSGGGQIGLSLASRHPDVTRTLVAHEPPTMMMLDDPAPEVAFVNMLHDTYRKQGVDAAMAAFFAVAGFGNEEGAGETYPEPDLTAEAAETFQRVGGNFEYWLAHGIVPLSTYEPDVAALRDGQPPIVVAIGEDSVGLPIDTMSRALALKLGVEPTAFPGDHTGFETRPAAFAEALDRAFKSR